MTFVTAGLAIAGVIAMAIPIIIHLLARQRRKPIEWAAMRFLIEAFRKHKRRLRIEQLLLLTVRCLIVGLLGFALARPILEATGIIAAGGARAVYIVLDDGLASGVMGEDGRSALQRHVRQAVDLVNSLGPGDSVGVITTARPARALLSPPSSDRAAVVDLLQSIAPKEAPTDFQGAFAHVRGALQESEETQQQTLVYVFSEFRAGSASLDSPLPVLAADNGAPVKLLAPPPTPTPVSNVQVTSIEPVRHLLLPGATDGSEQITVRLSRSGGTLGHEASTVRLSGENLPPSEPKTVQWQPGQSQADVKFSLAGGVLSTTADGATTPVLNQRVLSFTASIDDDALRADNQRHATIEARPQVRVLLIDRRSFGYERSLDQLTAGQWIRRALEPRALEPSSGPGARFPIQIVEVEPSSLDFADIRTAEVAVLPRPDLLNEHGWTVLRQFVDRNGLLIITPPAEVNIHQWPEQLAKQIDLPWRIALEVTATPEGAPLAEQQPASELLRLISSDLPDLARPVLVNRRLPVEHDASVTSDGAQPLLLFADGSPMMVAASPESQEATENQTSPDRQVARSPNQTGLVVYLAVAPELSWTNLPSKPLMVPLFQEIVRQGLSVIRASQQWQVGEQPVLATGPAARQVIAANGQSITLDQNGRLQQALDRAGVYTVQDQTNQPIGKIAVNIDSSAGLTSVQSAAAVSSWLNASAPGMWSTFDASNLAATLAVDRATSPIAGLLLLIVLGLAVVETILARRFSHAYEIPDTDAQRHGGTEATSLRAFVPSSLRASSAGGPS